MRVLDALDSRRYNVIRQGSQGLATARNIGIALARSFGRGLILRFCSTFCQNDLVKVLAELDGG